MLPVTANPDQYLLLIYEINQIILRYNQIYHVSKDTNQIFLKASCPNRVMYPIATYTHNFMVDTVNYHAN